MNPLFLGGMAGNLIGGYLMGQRQREMQMENQEMEQKKLKILMDAQKIKDAAEERKSLLDQRKLDAITNLRTLHEKLVLGQSDGAATETSGGTIYGDGFGDDSTSARNGAAAKQKPASVLDILSQDPLLTFLYKEETGIDIPGAVEAQRKAAADAEARKKNEFDKRFRVANALVTAGQGSWGQEVDPKSGNTYPVFRPNNPEAMSLWQQFLGGMAPGVASGGQMPSPAARDLAAGPQGGQPLPRPGGNMISPPMLGGGGRGMNPTSIPKPEATDIIMPDGQKGKQYRNPYSGQAMGDPWATDEKQPLSGEAAGRAGMLTSSLESLMQAKAILMPGGDLRQDWRKVVGAGPVPGLNAFVPGARDFDSHIENALAAKLRLETGANMPATEKTNLDKRFKPSPLDSEKLVMSKMDSLERFMRGSIEMLDPNKKYSSDAIKFTATDGKKYAWEPGKAGSTLPPAAVKALKEGVVTIFGNGKKYTLRNGQPVEVP